MTTLKLLWKAMRGDIILLTYNVTPDLSYTRTLKIMRLSESQAYSMGYRRGYRMLDQWRYLPFKTYVKFNAGSPQFPTQTIDDDGEEYVSLETAGTLYDSYRSKSAEKFVKGMTTKASITAGDQKKLLLVIAIGAIAAAAMAFLFLR